MDTAHTDYIRAGLDVQKGIVQDLQVTGVMEDVETLQRSLRFVKRSKEAILDMARTI